MNINKLTIGQAKELLSMFGQQPTDGLNDMVGHKCIIRTYSAGVWFGEIEKKSGAEVIVKNARRLWYWKAKKYISLSAVAKHGVDASACKFAPSVSAVWLEAIELIPCSARAIAEIEGCPDAEAS